MKIYRWIHCPKTQFREC